MPARLRRLAISAVMACTICVNPSEAGALDLFADELLPRGYTNSCQSQAIMLALALEKHTAFPIRTAGELRNAEIEFRVLIKNIAAEDPNLSVLSHETWRKALETYTQGNFFAQARIYFQGKRLG